MAKLLKKHYARIIGSCAALLVGIAAIVGGIILARAGNLIDYYINGTQELIAFRTAVNEGNNYAGQVVALSSNIDLLDEVWEPIGNTSVNAFAGTFEGQGYTISNLTGNSGLFGFVTGTVKNTGIVSGGIYSESQWVGGIANHVKDGRIENCYVGIRIESSRSQAEDLCVGGIVGLVTGSTAIQGCYTLSTATVEGSRFNTAAGVGVNGGNSYVGGIVGRAEGTATISSSYNQGKVKGVRGGDAGLNSADQFSGLAPGNGGNSYTAGIVGYINSANTVVANNHNDGAITGGMGGNGSADGREGGSRPAAIGGGSFTAGISNNNGNLLNNYNKAEIIGAAGGTGGRGANAIAESDESAEPISSCSKGGNGGISNTAGIATAGNIANCYNQGNIIGKNGGNGGACGTLTAIGHIGAGPAGTANSAGIVSDASGSVAVYNSYNTGKISGFGNIGGIVGLGAIINCFTIEGKGTGENGLIDVTRDGDEFDAGGGVIRTMGYLTTLLNSWVQNDAPTPPTGYAFAAWSGVELPAFVSGSGIVTNKLAALELIELADTLRAGAGLGYDPTNVTAFINYIDNTLAPIIDESIAQHILDDMVDEATWLLNRTVTAYNSEFPFVQVAAGGSHSLAIDADGNLWAWGLNDFGQLGNGDTLNIQYPILVNAFGGKKIVRIAAGENFSMALDEDGSVWTWGRNDNGQLGDGSRADKFTPVKLVRVTFVDGTAIFSSAFNDKPVVEIAAGYKHALAFNSSGELFAWGANANGQLGTGDMTERQAPILISAGKFDNEKVIAIAAGSAHSMAINESGNLYVWGLNANGQLGNDTTTSTATPVSILEDVTIIAAGSAHSMAVTADGKLYTWGRNTDGQLGDGTVAQKTAPVLVETLTKEITAISAGASHSLAVDSEGRFWAWGNNAAGRLGNNSTIGRRTPVLVNLTNSIGDKAVFVSAGQEHNMVIDETGRVWTWGLNRFGRLGDNTINTRRVPILIFEIPPKLPIDYTVANELVALSSMLKEDNGDYTVESVTEFLDYVENVLKPLLEDSAIKQNQLDEEVLNAASLLRLKPVPLKITLIVNGEITTLVYTQGEALGKPADPVTDKLFVGWYNNSEFNGKPVNINDWQVFVEELREDITLYARIVEYPKVILTEGETVMVTLFTSGSPTYPAQPDSREYFEFDGWYLYTALPGFGPKKITETDWQALLTAVKANAADVRLFAVWKPYVRLMFETNGGTPIDTKFVKPSDTLKDYKPNAPTKYGYEFTGWFKQASFRNVFDFGENQVAPATDTIVYARWTPKGYTVTYDSNGGRKLNTVGRATYGIHYEFAIPTRTHHDFVGWFSLDGKTQYTNSIGNSETRVWTLDADDGITVYAHWIIKRYEMRFDTGIGGSSIPSIVCNYYDLIPFSMRPQNPTKNFAVFQGWFTEPDGCGNRFNFETDRMPGGGITLYAHWIADLSSLQNFVNEMEEYRSASGYDPLLFNTFVVAMEEAGIVASDKESTVAEVKTAYERLHASAKVLGFVSSPQGGKTPPSEEFDIWIITLLALVIAVSIPAAVVVWTKKKAAKPIA